VLEEKKKYVGVPVEAFSSRLDTPWRERERYDTWIRRLSHPTDREAKELGRISLNSRSTAVERDRDRGSIDLSCRGLSLPESRLLVKNDVRPAATSPWCEQIVASSQSVFIQGVCEQCRMTLRHLLLYWRSQRERSVVIRGSSGR